MAGDGDITGGVHGDALAGATRLKTSIDAFVAAPTAEGLQAAKDAWKSARPEYLQPEMARFSDGPIDNAETGKEGLINAWPMDEGYIDYVEGDPEAGIINDPATFPTIDADLLTWLYEFDRLGAVRLMVEVREAVEPVAARYAAKRIPINLVDLASDQNPEQILMLDEALSRLESEDPEVAQVVRLRFFAGLTGQQAADVLGVSASTVDRDWAWARAWLFKALSSHGM